MSAMRSRETRNEARDAKGRAPSRAPNQMSSCRAGLRVRLALRILLAVSAAVVVAAAGNGRCRAQQSSMGGQPLSTPHGYSEDGGPFSTSGDPIDDIQAEKRMTALNAERQKSMMSDSEKLFKLATELNNEIAQSNTGELTPAQLRMVAEIEKLAHNVREKMAMSIRGPQMPGNSIDAPYQPYPSGNHH
jgi:hypothetical protein